VKSASLYHCTSNLLAGINNLFADNGLSDVHSFLYFPGDPSQMVAVVKAVFFQRGLRFIFSTRSKIPWILGEDGKRFFEGDYEFIPGKDDVVLEGTAGYVISFGDMLHRSNDAVLRCRQEGLDVGLINKATLNVVDEDVRFSNFLRTIYLIAVQVIRKVGQSPFVLIVESLNQKTGVSISIWEVVPPN
jgi:transketolase C-terminal domain/subunit